MLASVKKNSLTFSFKEFMPMQAHCAITLAINLINYSYGHNSKSLCENFFSLYLSEICIKVFNLSLTQKCFLQQEGILHAHA